MRIWIVLFLLVTHAAASTIFSQGARNVKKAASYGGVNAVGDGVTDDTQAFLDALNIGRHRPNDSFSPVAIYVPPGIYRVSQTLLIWGNTFLFGEPSSPPTVVLAANSANFARGANPFIVTVGGYNVDAYSTNWKTRTDRFNASTNNTFFIDVHDINFKVQSGNPGCSDVFLYACAQQTSLRNSVLTGDTATAHCLRTDLTGGGGIIQGVTCNATSGNAALQANDTYELLYRGCTFNGPVNLQGGYILNFVACAFNDNGGTGVLGKGPWFGLYDCTFGTGTPLSAGSLTPGAGHGFHLENVKWPNVSWVPLALQPYANSSGNVSQYTNDSYPAGTNYYNGVNVSGTSGDINACVKGSPYANPPYPRPTAGCVNVMSYGATGNGKTDDTASIAAAYAASKEVFFPIGTYKVMGSLKLSAGMKLFGCCPNRTIINITSSTAAISVTGNGSAGVVICGVRICQKGTGGCLQWNGDPSSIVMDSQFCLLSATGTNIVFQSGGGFFENGWWPADSRSAIGLHISSTGPLYLYSVQPEGYTTTCVEYKGAQRVYWLNFEAERSPAYVTITNSSTISMQGVLCGNTAVGISSARSGFNVFGVFANNSSGGIVQDNGTFYGGHSSGINFLDGYVRAEPTSAPTLSPNSHSAPNRRATPKALPIPAKQN
jgi:hypothetical protein